MKSFSPEGCKAGDVISRTNSNLFEKATIIIPTELGVIRNGTADKQYICFQTYKQLKEEGWTFEEVEERWKPKMDEEYFFIDTVGDIQKTSYSLHTDDCRWKIGNCFKTREEAEAKCAEIRKILNG